MKITKKINIPVISVGKYQVVNTWEFSYILISLPEYSNGIFYDGYAYNFSWYAYMVMVYGRIKIYALNCRCMEFLGRWYF